MSSQSKEGPSFPEREGVSPLSLADLGNTPQPRSSSRRSSAGSLSSSATDGDSYTHAGTNQRQQTRKKRPIARYYQDSSPQSLVQSPSVAGLYEEVSRPSSHIPKSLLQPEYQEEAARRKTFSNWPKTANIGAEELAKAGFIYTGHSDRVQCAFCRNTLESWCKDNRKKAFHIHQEEFPRCPFAWNPTSPQAVEEVRMNEKKSIATCLPYTVGRFE